MSSLVLMIAIYSSISTLWGLGYDCVNNKFTDESCEKPRQFSFIFTSVIWGLFYFLTH